MSAAARANLSAVRDAARQGEPDRYVAALLAPIEVRADLIALAAFSADVRAIPAGVTEPMIGEIRLQWWRDAIEAMPAGAHCGHPIADALAPVVAAGRIETAPLLDLLEARALDLYPDPPPDRAAFEAYLDKTETALFRAADRLVAGAHARVASDLLSAVGQTYGMSRLLHDLPRHLARGHLPLPVEWFEHTAIRPGMLLEGVATADVRVWLAGRCGDTRVTFPALRAGIQGLPRWRRSSLLPLSMAGTYLDRIADPRRDPLRDGGAPGMLRRMVRMGRAHARWSI